MKRPEPHRLPSVAVGDWNLSAELVEQLATKAGAQLVLGRAVDHGVASDDVVVHGVRRRTMPGSDHAAILLDLSVAGDRFRVLWWNVYVGQAPAAVLRAVCELVDEWQPHVVALGEAYRCRRELARVPGYRRHQARPGKGWRSEAAELALLVRRDVRVLRSDRLLMAWDWTGPVHGNRHGPRHYRRARLQLPGGAVVRLLAVHLPTGGYDGRNDDAVRESVGRIVEWLRP